MATRLILKKNTLIRPNLDYDLPVVSGCEAWNFFGQDNIAAARNLVPGKPNAKTFGAPVHSPHYTTIITNTNYYQLPQPDGPAGTLFCAVRRLTTDDGTAATRPVFFSTANNGVGGSDIAGIRFYTTTSLTWYIHDKNVDGTGLTPNQLTTGSPPVGLWRFYAVTWDATHQTIKALTSGTEVTETRTGKVLVNSIYPIGIGGNVTSTYLGQFDIHFSAHYSRVLTAGEIQAVAARVREFAARRSIEL